MKTLTKLGLGITLAFVLFFSNVSVGPLTENDVTEVQAAVKLSKTKLSLYVKKTATLKVNGTKKKVTWTSSNKKIATVTKKGKVTAVKKGTATITAKVGGKRYKCKVTVKNPTISKATATIFVGKTVTLAVNNAVGTVSWSSSNKNVASITSKGVVRGISKGTATITATASGVKLFCKVTIKNINVTEVTLDQNNVAINVGEKASLVSTVIPADATIKNVSWISADTSIATVDENGQVTGISAGITEVKVITEDQGKTATATVSVAQPVMGIEITSVPGIIYVKGDRGRIRANAYPDNAANKSLTYETSDSDIATVDEYGRVSAVNVGNATITIISASDPTIKKSVDITVGFSEKYFDIENIHMFNSAGEDMVLTNNTYVNDDGNHILTMYGTSSSIQNLTFDVYYSAVSKKVINSDKAGFDKMISLNYGDHSRKYYIEYTHVTPFTDDLYALGEITSIEEDKEYIADLGFVSENTVIVYSFTPKKSGIYDFTSDYADPDDEIDVIGTLYNSNKDILLNDEDFEDNFLLSCKLEAEKTYYLAIFNPDYIEDAKTKIAVTLVEEDSSIEDQENYSIGNSSSVITEEVDSVEDATQENPIDTIDESDIEIIEDTNSDEIGLEEITTDEDRENTLEVAEPSDVSDAISIEEGE